MTPNHAIFRYVFSEGLKVTDRTFDFLPEANTQYPFIYLGDGDTTDVPNFDLFGTASQRVHVYATRMQRAELDDMTSQLLNALRACSGAYSYALSFQSCNQQDLPDNTDVQPLIHRVLDVSFSYNHKGD